MPELLPITRFGDPVLREIGRELDKVEILSDEVQTLIEDMRYTLIEKEYGVGLAAPQVGARVALSVIGIKPTPNRPDLETFNTVIINPRIIETYGKRRKMWEGCVSCGTGNDILYAQVPRYEQIKLRWLDENAHTCEKVLGQFVAHVVQHEVDHLNGTLFVDLADRKTFMMGDEYKKRIVHANK
jgi:peptide deformylase